MQTVTCHSCKESETADKIGFNEECTRCGSPLHVCLNCRFHDPNKYNACHEPRAERVLEHDKANRCDWFEPGQNKGSAERADGASSIDSLKDLFK